MGQKSKTILILGNGFDLAHSLPTRYSDFLEFCKRVTNISEDNFEAEWIDNWKTDESIRNLILEEYKNRRGKGEMTPYNIAITQISNLIYNNLWYDYFFKIYKGKMIKGENWIDFESEIRFIIESIDRMSLSLEDSFGKIKNEDRKFLLFYKLISENYTHRIKNIKSFRESAYNDLEKLTGALEIYLLFFVEKININTRIPEIESLNPDYVISFNYTHIYEVIYNKKINTDHIYHIHGEAKGDCLFENNNMVLGIDEYWSAEERNNKTNFTIFKKFAQRIQKHTGNESYKYLKEIRELFVKENSGTIWDGNVDRSVDQPNGISHIYIFGHSLDVTDKDILSSFIGDKATDVTVYCYNKGTEGELIANTIKLIGEDVLIYKVNDIPPKLKYVIQGPVRHLEDTSEPVLN